MRGILTPSLLPLSFSYLLLLCRCFSYALYVYVLFFMCQRARICLFVCVYICVCLCQHLFICLHDCVLCVHLLLVCARAHVWWLLFSLAPSFCLPPSPSLPPLTTPLSFLSVLPSSPIHLSLSSFPFFAIVFPLLLNAHAAPLLSSTSLLSSLLPLLPLSPFIPHPLIPLGRVMLRRGCSSAGAMLQSPAGTLRWKTHLVFLPPGQWYLVLRIKKRKFGGNFFPVSRLFCVLIYWWIGE